MKIALFSDIHGNLPALEAILNDIKKADIDEIFCLGDVIAIGPQSRECLDAITAHNVKMVLGNHELYYVKGTGIDAKMSKEEKAHHNYIKSVLNKNHKKFLSNLPLCLTLKNNNSEIILEHFFIKDVKGEYPFYDLICLKNGSINSIANSANYKLIFIGHEHKAFNTDYGNKVFCLGSSGCTKDNSTFYYVVDIVNGEILVNRKDLVYNRSKLVEAFDTVDYPCKDFLKRNFFNLL